MTTIALILLFVAWLLLAIGANTPASGATRIGTVLGAVGSGLLLFGAVG